MGVQRAACGLSVSRPAVVSFASMVSVGLSVGLTAAVAHAAPAGVLSIDSAVRTINTPIGDLQAIGTEPGVFSPSFIGSQTTAGGSVVNVAATAISNIFGPDGGIGESSSVRFDLSNTPPAGGVGLGDNNAVLAAWTSTIEFTVRRGVLAILGLNTNAVPGDVLTPAGASMVLQTADGTTLAALSETSGLSLALAPGSYRITNSLITELGRFIGDGPASLSESAQFNFLIPRLPAPSAALAVGIAGVVAARRRRSSASRVRG